MLHPRIQQISTELGMKKLSFLVILPQKRKIAYGLQYDETEYTF